MIHREGAKIAKKEKREALDLTKKFLAILRDLRVFAVKEVFL